MSKPLCLAAALLSLLGGATFAAEEGEQKEARPNILFAIADDWGWPHAGAYGAPVVQTPTFDRLAREGVLFHHAYVSSPSCTPSRGAILTGKYHWELDGAANLHSVFPDQFTVYPEILARNGYAVGSTGKGWGPGRVASPDRGELAGEKYRSFDEFLEEREEGKPFCFWLGSSDPHRPYKEGSGRESGMNVDEVEVLESFPDVEEVRSDVADYFYEVQRFDSLVGDALAALEEAGELDNTLIFMTGDHGMPFPRSKSNVYDSGVRVCLAARWPNGIPFAGREVMDFVSTTDLAPTFLEAAGIEIPEEMSGTSLMPILTSRASGQVVLSRDHVIFGKERHVPSQEAPDMGGYPSRAIRTYDYLYIRNFKPERWPNGTPNYKEAAIPGTWYGDTDNGPTKTYIIENKDRDAEHRRYYQLSFGKRPAEELYDLQRDPEQLVNVAALPDYQPIKEQLSEQLMGEVEATGDPRARGEGDHFDDFEYLGGGPKHPDWEEPKPSEPQENRGNRRNRRADR